jgi:glycosyltransferase involved in cell wall biosynthesis
MFEVSPSVLFLLRKYPTVVTVHGTEDFTPSLLLWAFPREFFKRFGFRYEDLNLRGYLHYYYHRYVSSFVYSLGFRNVDRFVVFSKYMQELLRTDGINAVHIPNATVLFPAVPFMENSNVLAFVGRLERIKGAQDVIAALPAIIEKCPTATLEIAGAGNYESTLRQLAEELHVSKHVTFLGHRTRDELYELYKRSAMLVMPSIWPEPFGKVGIEAMSVGRPVIATDVGGISEWLIDGETGYLVQAEHPEEIAKRAIAILTDRSLRQKLSDGARERSKEFDIKKHAERIIALYEEVIQTSKKTK